MKTATTLGAIMLALLSTAPLASQTTTLTFDGIWSNLNRHCNFPGDLGTFQNSTCVGTRLEQSYPIIHDYRGQQASWGSPCNYNTADYGALSITDRLGGSGTNYALFFEDPYDRIVFGPFPYGISTNSILFSMYRQNSSTVGRMMVSAFDANMNPYPGGIPADSSSELFVVGSSSPILGIYSGTIPNGGYVMFRRVSRYGGIGGACQLPSGNFMVDDISFTANPVPVELTSFRCSVLDEKVRLNWTTATELNNFGFEVERSLDRENWRLVGFVQGAGTAFSPKKYDYMDVEPDWSAGVLYYRLRQIDRDGTTDFSPTVRADLAGASAAALELNVFPQPFNGSLQVQLSAKEETHMLVTLYNSLLQEVATLHDGTVHGSITASLPTPDLLDGNYFVVLRAGDQAPIVRKIVKLASH